MKYKKNNKNRSVSGLLDYTKRFCLFLLIFLVFRTSTACAGNTAYSSVTIIVRPSEAISVSTASPVSDANQDNPQTIQIPHKSLDQRHRISANLTETTLTWNNEGENKKITVSAIESTTDNPVTVKFFRDSSEKTIVLQENRAIDFINIPKGSADNTYFDYPANGAKNNRKTLIFTVQESL